MTTSRAVIQSIHGSNQVGQTFLKLKLCLANVTPMFQSLDQITSFTINQLYVARSKSDK